MNLQERISGRASVLLILALLLVTSTSEEWFLMSSDHVFYKDSASQAGVDLVVRSGERPNNKNYLIEGMTGGVCLFDYNNDGLLDIYFVNGSTLDKYRNGTPSDWNSRLYRNNGDHTFTDVTDRAGVGNRAWGMGCTAGDLNNDGWVDLYVTNLGTNVLYRNNGDGTFTEISQKSGTAHKGWNTGCAWGDFDGDGFLDLYVANYVDFDAANPPLSGSGMYCVYMGLSVMCGPRGLKPARGVLYHNNGDETFTDVTDKSGVGSQQYYSLGVSTGDYNNDGHLDIAVANDSTPNFLFRNRGDGTFDEVALRAGVAFNEDGRSQACMGIDFGDYDNDGWLDLFVTNFSEDTNTLYHNEGNGLFTDVTAQSGHGDSYSFMKWGTKFVDFDNDGFKDIFVANGHLYPEVENHFTHIFYRQSDSLYRNVGNGHFVNVSSGLGYPKHVGRGLAAGDLDNDGKMDIVISNMDDKPNVLFNQQPPANNWILVVLVGKKSNRSAIGARVSVETENGVQTGEVSAGGSYLSCSDPRVHFGLANVKEIRRLKVRWPSGVNTVLSNVRVNQILKIEELSN